MTILRSDKYRAKFQDHFQGKYTCIPNGERMTKNAYTSLEKGVEKINCALGLNAKSQE